MVHTTLAIAYTIKFGLDKMAFILQNNLAFGLDNGMAPLRRQVIFWTNVDHHAWCHMTSLGHDQLSCSRSDDHYNGVIKDSMASQITSLTIVYSVV